MSETKKKIQVPFDNQGNQLGYEDYDCTMRDNSKFSDTLEFTGISRGRSSVKFHFKRANGCKVEMFATDFEQLMLAGELKISGSFDFCKRGSNYGVRRAGGDAGQAEAFTNSTEAI